MLTITPNATTKDRIPLDFHILEKKVDLCFTSLHPVYNLSSPSCSQTLAGCFGVGVLPRGVKSSPSAPCGPDLECKAPCIVAASFSGAPGNPSDVGPDGKENGTSPASPPPAPTRAKAFLAPVPGLRHFLERPLGIRKAGFSGLLGTRLPGQREVIYADAGTQC